MLAITLDTTALRDELTEIERTQYPFAMSRAMNDALPLLQQHQRAGIMRRFTIAPSAIEFLERMVKINPREDRSTKYNLAVSLRIEGPRSATGKGAGRAGILSRHEDGGVRRADQLDYPFVIPTDDLRGGRFDLVPRKMYPSNLRLAPRRAIDGGIMEPKYRTTRKGTLQLQGKHGTFVMDDRKNNPKLWGIFQRFSKHRDGIRMIWAFRKQITLPKRLGLIDTVQRVGPDYVAQRFAIRLAEAMTTRRR